MKTKPRAWNAWYHFMNNTYGTWLRGDARGWRARHHREHVEGDYKNPPKEDYRKLHQRSKDLMKRDPVHIAKDRQQFVLDRIVEKFLELGVVVIMATLDDHHVHLLARFPDHRPREWMGRAKKHASHSVRALDGAPTGGLWAKRGKAEPVADRDHQLNIIKYLVEHWERGAALYLMPSLRGREEEILEQLRDRKRRRKGHR